MNILPFVRDYFLRFGYFSNTVVIYFYPFSATESTNEPSSSASRFYHNIENIRSPVRRRKRQVDTISVTCDHFSAVVWQLCYQ